MSYTGEDHVARLARAHESVKAWSHHGMQATIYCFQVMQLALVADIYFGRFFSNYVEQEDTQALPLLVGVIQQD